MLSDSFFNKVEKKTKVDKETIIGLAEKLQNGNMKDEKTLREVIDISKEQSDKIISKVIDGNVPKNIDKMF